MNMAKPSATSATVTLAGTSAWTLSVGGTLTIAATGVIWTNSGTMTISAASYTFDTNNVSIASPITHSAIGFTLLLASNATVSSFNLTGGTLDLGNFTLTCTTQFTGSNSNTRAIAFGTTGAITVTGSGLSAFSMGIVTNFTYTGTSKVNISNNSATAATVTFGTTGGTEANSLNFNITVGTYTLTIATGSFVKDLNFTGFTGTCSPIVTIYGSLTLVSGMTITSPTFTFASTSTGKTITSAGKTIGTLTFTGVGGGWTLSDAATVAGLTTLTAGTLNLNNFTLSSYSFSLNSTSVRSIAFGTTGQITVNGTGLMFDFPDYTNFTFSGTSKINISNNSAVASSINTIGCLSTNTALNLNFTTGTYTLTTGASLIGRNINFTGFTGSIDSFVISTYGSLTLVTGMTLVNSCNLTFFGITTGNTINTAGKTIASLAFNGSGGGWTLASAINSLGDVSLYAGSLDTAGFAVTATQFKTLTPTLSTATKSLTTGASTFTLSLGWNIETSLYTTINSDTSVITISNTAPYFYGAGFTYYSVIFSSTAITNGYVTGSNTYTSLEFAARSATGISDISIGGNQTVTGTFKLNNGNSTSRTFIHSDVIGTQRTFNVGTLGGGGDNDFRDIAATGASSPWNFTGAKRGGNCLGNSGITFDAAKTVYWNLTGSQLWSAAAWVTSSGGSSPSTANFPLAQDTAVFDNAGAATTVTLNANYNIGTINFSSRTTAVTFATGTTTPIIYGNLLYSTTRPTQSGTGTITFAGQGITQTITTNSTVSLAIPQPLNFDTNSGTVSLGSNLYVSNSITLTSGSFNTGTNYNVTTTSFYSSNTKTRAVTLGTSTITLNGTPTNTWDITVPTGMTLSAASSTITFFSAFSVFNYFYGGGLTYGTLSNTTPAGGPTLISGTNTIGTLSFTSFGSGAGILPVTLYNNQTITNIIFNNSGGYVYRTSITSDVIGTTRTISGVTGTATLSNVDFRDITISGTAAGLTNGTGVGDLGGNSGFTITPASIRYWNLAAGGNWNANGWAATSGGTPSLANFPLPQDTVQIGTGAGLTAGNTITINGDFNLPIINFSARATAMTLAFGTTNPVAYGNVTLSSSVTLSGTGSLTFSKRGTQTITSAGRAFTTSLVINTTTTSTVQLADALLATNTLTVTRGTFDAGTSSVTATTFASSNTNVRSVKMGTGSWTLTGTGTVWDITDPTNMVFEKGTSSITMTSVGTTARAFYSNGIRYGAVVIGGTTGTSPTTFYGSLNTFDDMSTTKTVAYTVTFEADKISQFKKFSLTGASGAVLTLNSSSANKHTLKKFTPWLVGVNSTQSTCTGLSLTAGTPAIDWIAFSNINGTVSSARQGNMSFFFR
jgi:hypothetical protein